MFTFSSDNGCDRIVFQQYAKLFTWTISVRLLAPRPVAEAVISDVFIEGIY